jgi:hypothetical protein
MNARLLDRNAVKIPFGYALCLSSDSLAALLEEEKVPVHKWPEFLNETDHAAVTHFIERDRHYNRTLLVVCMNPDKNSAFGLDTAALLVHEAVHIFQEMARYMSEKNPSDEFMAYSIQHISEELFAEYRRQTGKKK